MDLVARPSLTMRLIKRRRSGKKGESTKVGVKKNEVKDTPVLEIFSPATRRGLLSSAGLLDRLFAIAVDDICCCCCR